MAQPLSRFSKFWNELKRRKVFRVLAMYAATAFIILEASDIMLPRLGLPDWTVTFVIVLIIIGFPITAIVSWIFDITPEGLMKTMPLNKEKKNEINAQSNKSLLNANNIVITLLIAAVVILVYPKVFNTNKSQFHRSRENKTIIAVLPFMNNTGDDSYNHWEYGISELLISSLSTSNELKVIDNQTISDVIQNVENIQTTSIGPDIAKQVANRIQVKSYIYGNYLLAGSTLRINLKLIETKTNEVLKTLYVEGKADSIFSMVDILSDAIMDYLEITEMEEGTDIETTEYLTTSSPEAYKYFIQGLEAVWTGQGGGLNAFFKAIEIDSTFTSAYLFFSIGLSSNGAFNWAQKAMLKAYEGKDQLPEKMQLWLEAFMAQYIEKNPYKTINYFEQASELDPLSRLNWYWLAHTYIQIENYDDALLSFEQILKLNKQFGPWKSQFFINDLGNTYLHLKKYNKAQKILKEGISLMPEAGNISRTQAVCALLKNDSSAANQYINQFKTSFRKFGDYYPESWILAQEGKVYAEAGQIGKAEKLFRRALEMRLGQGPERDTINPGNDLYWYYHILGDILINDHKSVGEGMDYLQKSLALSIEAYGDHHPFVLHSLGSGLYKQGKYVAALQALKQAEENMSMYDHSLRQHIQEVEQALVDQNN
jgi:tetratricopeptide (TPR) repeat protein